MAALAPFDLLLPSSPAFDRYTAYWYTTLLSAVYLPATTPRLFLYQIAGGTSVERVGTGVSPFPAADVALFPSNRAVVVIRGTTTTTELLFQAAGVVAGPIAPWAGRVGIFWSAATVALWAFVRPILVDAGVTSAAWSGHSYGAAVATLLPDLASSSAAIATQCQCTIASPRVGDLTFAQSQTNRYLRISNQGDPVPMVPPSFNSVLDRTLWILSPIPPAAYWHVGSRAHLFVDGRAAFPPEQSTWASAEEALLFIALGLDSWYADHNTNEYARRLRIGIPAAWLVPSVEFPGIDTIDGYWAQAAIDPPASTWFTSELCPS